MNWYACTMCEYISPMNRRNHAVNHYERIHIKGGRPFVAKRTYSELLHMNPETNEADDKDAKKTKTDEAEETKPEQLVEQYHGPKTAADFVHTINNGLFFPKMGLIYKIGTDTIDAKDHCAPVDEQIKAIEQTKNSEISKKMGNVGEYVQERKATFERILQRSTRVSKSTNVLELQVDSMFPETNDNSLLGLESLVAPSKYAEADALLNNLFDL